MISPMKHPLATLMTVLFATCCVAAQPDFGPNVLVFEPSQKDAQERINAVFKEQERAQFGTSRYALLFKPGNYDLEVPVGFYTHVAGLGKLPGEVVLRGHVWTDAGWMGKNATCNFWRTVENLTIAPPSGSNMWAVSQAAPLRRTHIRGDLHLSSGGWSSGGFMADCRIEGVVKAGSQQQWFSRNSGWSKWEAGQWNIVFAGCVNPPSENWPAKPFSVAERSHVVREKPFLTMTVEGHWEVQVPRLRPAGSLGPSWVEGAGDLIAIPIDQFHIVRADRDTAATINQALRTGKHLLITPGLYRLDDTIMVSNPNTVILGLGLASLSPASGKPVLLVEGEGVFVSGLVIDASETEVQSLVQVGHSGRPMGRAANPVCLHDLFCRAGGTGPGKAKTMVTLYADHVIGDNLWLWRADHGKDVGWTNNTCDTGLRVDGNDVTIYGLFVEHTQRHQTIWNGDRGNLYFYQSEMPYDPPSQSAWLSPSGNGYASYKVGDAVSTHNALGLGVYHVFKKSSVIADTAVETPIGPGIRIHHAFTFRLGGGLPGSGIRNVINSTGGDSITRQKATLD